MSLFQSVLSDVVSVAVSSFITAAIVFVFIVAIVLFLAKIAKEV